MTFLTLHPVDGDVLVLDLDVIRGRAVEGRGKVQLDHSEPEEVTGGSDYPPFAVQVVWIVARMIW